jgi:hypothetical protein
LDVVVVVVVVVVVELYVHLDSPLSLQPLFFGTTFLWNHFSSLRIVDEGKVRASQEAKFPHQNCYWREKTKV